MRGQGWEGDTLTMPKLTDIDGLGEYLAEKLRKNGIRTPEALLTRGSTRTGIRELSESCGIQEERLVSFVSQADLMRITGIGTDYAKMLMAVGVLSVRDLSRQDPGRLADAILELVLARGALESAPTKTRIADWLDQARELEGSLTRWEHDIAQGRAAS
jgi:predicted flap endonuclease-1-like 5' DNA nuclease